MRSLGRCKLLKGRSSKRTLLLSAIVALLFLLIRNSHTNEHEYDKKNRSRDAKNLSPFFWIQSRREVAFKRLSKSRLSFLNPSRYSLPTFSLYISQRESELLLNWDATAKAAQCRYMIDAIYLVNEGWTNNLMTHYHGQQLDDLLISLLGERLRIYNYCFSSPDDVTFQEVFELDSILDPQNTFNVSPDDFMSRMFPFLRNFKDIDDPLWPEVTNLQTGLREKIPDLPKDFNQNFWSYWLKYSQGEGVVITLAEKSKTLLFKQLKVLDHLGNTLPIQIVTKGTEFSPQFINELKYFVDKTNQQVYLVDCAPLLNPDFAAREITNVVNKWLAVIFNTFEEAILLDVDAVPFVPMKRFFDDPRYKSSGMLLYKDRNMPEEHTFDYCIAMLAEVEPSIQEESLINSRLKFSLKQTAFEESEEAHVFKGFFHHKFLHHVDSGLVVINKVSNLNGLIFSFMLNLDGKMKLCVYGDKELFWLGQLFAGQTYSIHPVDGGIVGPVVESASEDKESTSYQICSTQIAHSSESDELLWTNGGLKTCKISDSARKDFGRFQEYFEERYGSVQTLEKIYDSPLKIEGVIVPDVHQQPWIQLYECAGYVYCANVVKKMKGHLKTEVGHIVDFQQEALDELTEVAQIWNDV